MNIPVCGIRENPRDYSNKHVMGIRMNRYGASWLNAGGDFNDQEGFLLWMMNIPFENDKGEIEYISQDDAEDAYDLMNMGKCELESTVRDFLKHWDAEEQEYTE